MALHLVEHFACGCVHRFRGLLILDDRRLYLTDTRSCADIIDNDQRGQWNESQHEPKTEDQIGVGHGYTFAGCSLTRLLVAP